MIEEACELVANMNGIDHPIESGCEAWLRRYGTYVGDVVDHIVGWIREGDVSPIDVGKSSLQCGSRQAIHFHWIFRRSGLGLSEQWSGLRSANIDTYHASSTLSMMT